MSFPYHDRNWNEVVDVVLPHLSATDRMLAPDPFWWRLPCPIERWVSTNLSDAATYDWVIVHKGELEQFPRSFLEHVATTMRPVFANKVFVVWTTKATGSIVDASSPDLIAFFDIVASLPSTPGVMNAYELERILRGKPVLTRFADLNDADLREEENAFFREGGYQYLTLRDRGYYQDVHRHFDEAIDRWAGGRILDVGCGAFALNLLPPSTQVTRIDFAHEGVRLAVAADRDQAGINHATMDGHRLGFPGECFDAVALVDVIEHVRNAGIALREAARVLRPGGELLISYTNRNSVNQVITRKLGHPEFMTNHQHIREFTPDEMGALLAATGFEVLETSGVGLLPFWGIPGIDEVVRTLTDDDPDVVEMMRVVGRRAGADYAFVGVALARKHAQ